MRGKRVCTSMRVTVGAQAAVHGLLFVGISYVTACHVAGVRQMTMRPYIDVALRRAARGKPGIKTFYSDDFIAKAREMWRDEDTPLRLHAKVLGITENRLAKIAENRGWPARKRGSKSVEAHLRRRLKNPHRCFPHIPPIATVQHLPTHGDAARGGAHLEAAPREALIQGADDQTVAG